MRGSIIIFVFTFFVHELLADVIYKIDDVCRGLKRRPTTKDILRRHFSRRQFGAILDIPRGEAVSVILGNPQPQEGLLSSYQPSYGKNEADPVKTNLDCRFTLKPPKPGSNVIHSPDMILIRMTATGSYTFTSTLYFPLHVRISVCESAPSSLGFLLVASSTDDLNEICSKQAIFNLELVPLHKALFQFNSSLPLKAPGEAISDKGMFVCLFSLRTRRVGLNATLDIDWHHFNTGCRDFIQIKKADGSAWVNLNGSGRHVLHLPNIASVDLYLSLCRGSSTRQSLRIWAATSNLAPGNSQSDVSSIILAFMAPFAFILLAVVMAVMGSCCCGKKCQRPAVTGGPSAAEEPNSATATGGDIERPSGSRDILLTAASLADKPPSYADLFPADYIFKEESKVEPKCKLGDPGSALTSRRVLDHQELRQNQTVPKPNAQLWTRRAEGDRNHVDGPRATISAGPEGATNVALLNEISVTL